MPIFKTSEHLLGEGKKITSVEVAKQAIETEKISKEFAEEIVKIFDDMPKDTTWKEKFNNLRKKSLKIKKKEKNEKSEKPLADGELVVSKKEAKYLKEALFEIEQAKEIEKAKEKKYH